MKFEHAVFIGVITLVGLHFVVDGTMPTLLNQLAQIGGTASTSLQPVARAIGSGG